MYGGKSYSRWIDLETSCHRVTRFCNEIARVWKLLSVCSFGYFDSRYSDTKNHATLDQSQGHVLFANESWCFHERLVCLIDGLLHIKSKHSMFLK